MSNLSEDKQAEEEQDEVESPSKAHKKTVKLTKHYENDLMRVKSILEEEVIEKIDKTIIDSFYGLDSKDAKKSEKKKKQVNQETNKSTAGAIMRHKIEKDEPILKMTDKYNEQSRFCQLQSSSSSSSEKSLALGQIKKFSTNVLDENVPEEEVEVT